ncbi:MAG: phytoene/squalene synthase family protein [Ferruginibacter sp.]
MIQHFHDLSSNCSRITTSQYSTSFNSAIRLLHKDLQSHIHNIYGLVRLADEIVDSFHDHNKEQLLSEFKLETYKALDRGISLNPILHSFQITSYKYDIDRELVDAFFNSMEADLSIRSYNAEGYKEYIYGSAEVVGLMCLYVFCEGNKTMYENLRPYAQALGAAFQKVNFLRDISQDHEILHRFYFPGVDFNNFTADKKREVELDIKNDFQIAAKGIAMLPVKAKFGVYVAYKYYLSLFNKIKNSGSVKVIESRIRIPNYSKALILINAGIRNQLNII